MVAPKTLANCINDMKGYADMEIAGQWVQIWSTDATSGTSDKPKWLTISRGSATTSAIKLKFAI